MSTVARSTLHAVSLGALTLALCCTHGADAAAQAKKMRPTQPRSPSPLTPTNPPDPGLHDKLLAKVRTLAAQRADFANRIAIVQKLAEGAKGDEKKDIAGAALRTVDSLIDSLKPGEASDKSSLFNAARYLGHASRTANALVLDVDCGWRAWAS